MWTGCGRGQEVLLQETLPCPPTQEEDRGEISQVLCLCRFGLGMALASQVLPTEGYRISGFTEYIPIDSFPVIDFKLTFVYGIILIFGILIAYRPERQETRRLQREQVRAYQYTDQEWQEWQGWQSNRDSTQESQEQQEQDSELDPINDPGHRPDIKRMIPAESRHVVSCGYIVPGDNEVTERREEFVQSLRPSIEDYLTQEQIEKIINGDMDAPSVPMYPDEWDGSGRAQRDAMLSVLEDALLLGLEYEEMNAATVREARKIRAGLNHTRSMGRDIGIQRVSEPRTGFFSCELHRRHFWSDFSFLWACVNPCSRCLVRFTQVH